jgi:peptide/nickel transport system substrate-binding protein
MAEWCDAFAKVQGTAPAIEQFVTSREIRGVSAPDDSTLVIRLRKRSVDFLHTLVLPFASPMPVEYLAYVPDGPEFRAHTISSGPYRITSYVPMREISLGRNPAWDPATDPLRNAYVDSIHVVMGIGAPAVQQQLEVGTADLSWDQPPPTAELGRLITASDPNLVIGPDGDRYVGLLYLTINLLSPNAQGAFGKVEVRQALNYAIDRPALAQIYGGPQIARPAHQAVVSTASGYREGYDPYPTAGERGDSARARQLLAQAGYPGGLPIKLLYRTNGIDPLLAQTVQASLTKAGFQVQLVAATASDFFAKYLTAGPESARRGVWDVAITDWYPDWFGNNGRTVIEALFDGRSIGPNSVNYGAYDADDVEADIDRALAATTAEDSYAAWSDAATKVIEDAALAPLVQFKVARYQSSRVKNCVFMLLGFSCNLTSVWLQGAGTS